MIECGLLPHVHTYQMYACTFHCHSFNPIPFSPLTVPRPTLCSTVLYTHTHTHTHTLGTANTRYSIPAVKGHACVCVCVVCLHSMQNLPTPEMRKCTGDPTQLHSTLYTCGLLATTGITFTFQLVLYTCRVIQNKF